VETPVFMPVGTRASVTGIAPDELTALGASIILANTYHLLLQPGPDLFRRVGGIHTFMRWPGLVLTDSGGYQIFSLPEERTMSEDGARFRSYIDGSARSQGTGAESQTSPGRPPSPELRYCSGAHAFISLALMLTSPVSIAAASARRTPAASGRQRAKRW
jgi:queuine tRNA-ribosyltransferase